jgi:uncharacterized protein (DUF2147 family)
MRNLTLVFAACFASISVYAQKATDNFAGKYKTDDGGIITVTKTPAGFIGTDPDKKVVLKDVAFDGKEWKATMYNPKKDMTASAEILLENGKLKIVAHKSIMTKTIYWVLIK